MPELVVDVARREETGKNVSRRLRRQGLIPAILYGEGKEPVPVNVEAKIVHRILHSEKGENTLFELAMKDTGQKRLAMIKEYQLDPVSDLLIHADFVRISADREVQVNVHIELHGTPHGVKTEGGLLEFTLREVAVTCLPKDIPTAVKLDVSELKLNHVLRVGDLPMPEGVRAVSDKSLVVCSVHVPKAEALPTPAAAAVPAEGEAAAAAAAAPGAAGAAPSGAAPEAKEGAAKEAKPAKEGKPGKDEAKKK